MAPPSSVTRSGTHFNKYGAWTGGVIDAIALIPTSSSSVRASAFSCNISLHENEMLWRNLLFLKHPLVVRLTSMTTPRVANSQYKCHVFCQFLQDKLTIDLFSFNDLWDLCVRSRRNSLLMCALSISPFKNTYTCYQKSITLLPFCKPHKYICMCCVKPLWNSTSSSNQLHILLERDDQIWH